MLKQGNYVCLRMKGSYFEGFISPNRREFMMELVSLAKIGLLSFWGAALIYLLFAFECLSCHFAKKQAHKEWQVPITSGQSPKLCENIEFVFSDKQQGKCIILNQLKQLNCIIYEDTSRIFIFSDSTYCFGHPFDCPR